MYSEFNSLNLIRFIEYSQFNSDSDTVQVNIDNTLKYYVQSLIKMHRTEVRFES